MTKTTPPAQVADLAPTGVSVDDLRAAMFKARRPVSVLFRLDCLVIAYGVQGKDGKPIQTQRRLEWGDLAKTKDVTSRVASTIEQVYEIVVSQLATAAGEWNLFCDGRHLGLWEGATFQEAVNAWSMFVGADVIWPDDNSAPTYCGKEVRFVD